MSKDGKKLLVDLLEKLLNEQICSGGFCDRMNRPTGVNGCYGGECSIENIINELII